MKTLTWSAFIVSLLALGLAAFLLFQRYYSPAEPTATTSNNEVANTTNDAAGGTSLANSPDASRNDTPSSGSTYINERYGYTVILPSGWTAAEERVADSPKCPDLENQNVTNFADANATLNVRVGLRAVGDDVAISCRTGVGAGAPFAGDAVEIGDTAVPSTTLRDNFGGTPIEVFVGSEPTSDGQLATEVFTIGTYELVVTISQTEPINDPNAFEPSYTDITTLPEYAEALDLLASIQLP